MLSSAAITRFFVFVFFLCMIAGAVFYNTDKLFPKQQPSAANTRQRSLWFEEVLTRPWFNPETFRSLTSVRINPMMGGSKSAPGFYGDRAPLPDNNFEKPVFDTITALNFMEMRYEFAHFDEQKKKDFYHGCQRLGISPGRWLTDSYIEQYPFYKKKWVLGFFPAYELETSLDIPCTIGVFLYVKNGGAGLNSIPNNEKYTFQETIKAKSPATFLDTINALIIARNGRLKSVIQN